MNDCIIYVPDFPALVTFFRSKYPELVADFDGEMTIENVTRTPAKKQGDERMVYARISNEDIAGWASTDLIELWGVTPFTGPGTAQAVYDSVFADEDQKAIYDRLYPHEPYEAEMEGESLTITPSPWFGILAGA